MYRYLVLVWNGGTPALTTSAQALAHKVTNKPGWSVATSRDGLLILHAGLQEGACNTVVLRPNTGAVLGRVFKRQQQPWRSQDNSFDSEETGRIIGTAGKYLLTCCWGRYVSVIWDEALQKVSVLRDPSGALPCFLTTFEGVRIFFSDAEDVLALGLSFSVNWQYLGAFALYSSLEVPETGLVEVTEVRPGENIEISKDGIKRSLRWDPFAVAQTNVLDDPSAAAAELRSTVRDCVHAWASCHSTVIHTLSGGLDSSIVLACLSTAPTGPAITCVNYFTDHLDEDERRYARIAASRANAELVECPMEEANVDLRKALKIARSAKPSHFMYELEHGAFEVQLARDSRATAVFSGTGGDAIFMKAGARFAAADFIAQHGFVSKTVTIALDAARLTQQSVWAVLARSITKRLRAAPNDGLPEIDPNMSFVRSDLIESVRNDRRWQPWYIALARNIPEGTFHHIAGACLAPAFYGLLNGTRNLERTHPLLSQPVAEVCFRIPTYLWIKDGQDRSIARRAFASDVPLEIIRRSSKGCIEHHSRCTLDLNRGFIREMLLDGVLVKKGVLNPHKLEAYLSADSAAAGFEYNHILQKHLCTEAWARCWT